MHEAGYLYAFAVCSSVFIHLYYLIFSAIMDRNKRYL